MKRVRVVLVFSLSLLIFFGACSRKASESPELKEWTILFYAAGDEEEIGAATRKLLKRIEQVPGIGREGLVNIVAQHDDVGEDPNYRYALQHVTAPSNSLLPDTAPVPEAEIQKFEPGFHYQERDSSNPATLKKFIRWAVRAYPARHYALVFAGHSWGNMGFSQDFHLPGHDVEKSSMIRLYEFRRLMEEIYREEKANIPSGKFDLYVADACIAGQLEIAAELKDVFRYFMGSAVETTLTSLPYHEALPGFVKAVNALPKASAAQADLLLEEHFLKPLARQYVLGHARGGNGVTDEGEMDPVHAFAVRTARLDNVLAALTKLTKALPLEARKEWHPAHGHANANASVEDEEAEDRIPQIEKLDDMDTNADLLRLSQAFQAYSSDKLTLYLASEGTNGPNYAAWDSTLTNARELEKTLGYQAKDPSAVQTVIAHPKAVGAWAQVQIDEYVKPRELGVCIALKSFMMMNVQDEEIAPTLTDANGDEVDPLDLDCNDAYSAYLAAHHLARIENASRILEHPRPMDKIFDMQLKWPHGIPAYVSEKQASNSSSLGTRSLWIWFSSANGHALQRAAHLRLVGTNAIDIHYLSGAPKEYVERGYDGALLVDKVSHEDVPSYVVNDDAKDFMMDGAPGLYVVEAHTNATQFKTGLGLSIKTLKDAEEDSNMGGRIPIEKIEKTPYAMTIEDYMQTLEKSASLQNQTIRGPDFYRLHRISATGWADFLFSDPAK